MPEIRDDGRWSARLREIAQRVGSQPYVKVGFPEGATYPDGTSLPLVAIINEFGRFRTGRETPAERKKIGQLMEQGQAKHIQPPRPFMRNTIAEHKKDWPAAAAQYLAEFDMDAIKALNMVGEGIKSQIIQSIQNLFEPALAASTIRRKKFALDPTKPLIDTGFMWQHVSVETGNESVT